jgi:hypothetical protein
MTAYDKAKKATLKESKRRADDSKWETIDDSKVRHVWANPDGTGEITVDPAWYADNGTPVCVDAFDGEDMIYVRTEILA